MLRRQPSRILVIRLDRIGDLVLSTPVLTALRDAFPGAAVSVMVQPVCEDLVQGHPAVHEVIVYDKRGKHRSPFQTMRFALSLRSHKFDVALVLHPTNRSHWIVWLAGIPTRIGYARKLGAWLLNRPLVHRKQEGTRHERDYTLELLKPLGITPRAIPPTVALQDKAKSSVEAMLTQASIPSTHRLVTIHPSASCPSKRWLPERFAQVADRLIEEQGVSVCIVAAATELVHAEAVKRAMRRDAVMLAGKLSVAELTACLVRSELLVSNDSGPVHIAAAVGTAVVDIFGRNQRGLSPQRWGPIGEGHIILHKDVGCVTCLAHNCDIQFRCLTELTVDEVYQAAASLLNRTAHRK